MASRQAVIANHPTGTSQALASCRKQKTTPGTAQNSTQSGDSDNGGNDIAEALSSKRIWECRVAHSKTLYILITLPSDRHPLMAPRHTVTANHPTETSQALTSFRKQKVTPGTVQNSTPSGDSDNGGNDIAEALSSKRIWLCRVIHSKKLPSDRHRRHR